MLVLACACTDPAGIGAVGEGSTPSAELVVTPQRVLDTCTRFPRLRPACPTRIPAVDDVRYRQVTSSAEDGLAIFVAQWNAPWEELPERNAPPAFAHLNVLGGDLSTRTAFDIEPSSWRAPEQVRDYGLGFGRRTWNGRSGALYLAPTHGMGGGIEGDHLVFRWSQGGRDFSISLHSWNRLDETEATLRAIVESLP